MRTLEGPLVSCRQRNPQSFRQQLTSRLESEATIGARHQCGPSFSDAHRQILAAWLLTIVEQLEKGLRGEHVSAPPKTADRSFDDGRQ
jgi:hypothetical protein